MNTKRQTIWLVSMLSLMVILSAYYLFTDNVDEMNTVSQIEDSEQLASIDEVILDEQPIGDELSTGILDDTSDSISIDEADQVAEVDQVANEPDQTEATAPDQTETSAPDKEVLDHMQAGAQTGEDYLSALVIKRNDTMAADAQRLMDITSDPKKSNDEMVQAQEQLDAIEDMQYKITDLEDQLMQDFENVVITEEKGKWKAVVQADKLERSQAVTIMDMMIQNLQITPNKIAGVQFVQ
ncbi:MAG: SpoIIIAH-like family protein [Paenibacillaceae bacterium]